MQKSLLYFGIIFFLLLNSCQKANICDCIKRNGELDSVEIEFSRIKFVEINKMFNVYLINDTVNKAIIKTWSNLLELIDLQVKDSTLYLHDNNICNFGRSYDNKISVYLHLTNLETLDIKGPSSIFSLDTLNFDKLLIRISYTIADVNISINSNHLWFEYWSATGNAIFQGNTNYFEVLSDGTGYIDALNLKSKVVKLRQITTGDTKLNVIDALYVSFFDIGDVYYIGNPKIVEIQENKSNKQLIHIE